MYDRERCETLEEKAFEAFTSCELTVSNNDAIHDLLRATGEVRLPTVMPSQKVLLEWSAPNERIYIEVTFIDGMIDSWYFHDSTQSNVPLTQDSASKDVLLNLIKHHFGNVSSREK